MYFYTYLEKRVEVPINFYSTTFRYEPIKSNKNAIKYHTKAVAGGGVNHPPQGTPKVNNYFRLANVLDFRDVYL